jgi:ribonuclease P protein subunit RPR2
LPMSRRSRPREKTKRLAEARVDILWEKARNDAKSGLPEQARQKMISARRIAQRARTKIPRQINRRVCKVCGTVLILGNTCRVRVRHKRAKHVVVSCLNCGAIKRYYI